MNQNKIGVMVFIYEASKKIFGTITAINENGEYVVQWSDGEITEEPINEFNPAGWLEYPKGSEVE